LNLREVVDTWRELHSPIRDLWYGCERAFRCAINGDDTWAGPFEYVASDNRDAVACYLPSGRPIVYNKARVDGTSRGGIVYKGTADDRAQAFCPKCCTPLPPKSKNCAKHGEVSPELWVRTYGGKLVENAIQAMCRDLMTSAMLRAEAAGLRVVLHVHDELVCEVPEAGAEDAYKLLHACMTALPPWAEGFPIGADGYVAKRYRK
jgi:DNA polymerase